ncbi:protein-(glutamine-N5) methyltransferase, release factor-specific [candidate division LCP-89 bacterium B3_LCP]|uniref:Release factor glutamine methyltransferase n=1 Tax=candidate division LCP-89 bacterium B3_LCP TaxID=2012998 RepID=A0A532V3Q9_UNCL8|nr:MAG: protein-(glutamine-N5) methyltransferase, release factor-specific [candidate division LCP-89 bacterium B3_LCP]
MLLRQATYFASEMLLLAAINQPKREAEWMIETIAGVSRARIYTDDEVRLDSEQEYRLRDYLERRCNGEPLQYILGTVQFRRLDLKIDNRALIPRPETEGLVELGLGFIKDHRSPLVLDIGTGSGAITLSVVDEHPGSACIGLDISEDALTLAKENSEITANQERVTWMQGDIFADNFDDLFECKFDLILSNPPYVSFEERETLAPEIRNWEPEVALFSPEDGTRALRRLAQVCQAIINPKGKFACEIGEMQGHTALNIFQKEGWEVKLEEDLNGKTRYLTARQ